MIADRHSVLSKYETAGEFKKNNKHTSLKKDAGEEYNALSLTQVKFKCQVCSAKGHRFLDCKKRESAPYEDQGINKRVKKSLQECTLKEDG